ncbi:reverse transcriptase domain-containing protein [Tanacetum coccineum]
MLKDRRRHQSCAKLGKVPLYGQGIFPNRRPITILLEKETRLSSRRIASESILITLKMKLTQAPILVAPDWDLPFEIMCDASDFVVGAVLGQHQVIGVVFRGREAFDILKLATRDPSGDTTVQFTQLKRSFDSGFYWPRISRMPNDFVTDVTFVNSPGKISQRDDDATKTLITSLRNL